MDMKNDASTMDRDEFIALYGSDFADYYDGCFDVSHETSDKEDENDKFK
tara:strand:- start:656 stop:802 length:147 start_codon:yes stop_codon:yes gene_type:complete